MKTEVLEFAAAFDVVLATKKAQVAIMTLSPGQTVGGDDNVHAESEQWLFVVAGNGEAVIAGKHQKLTRHTLVVIEAGESHEIRNTGDAPLETLNFYTPPEF